MLMRNVWWVKKIKKYVRRVSGGNSEEKEKKIKKRKKLPGGLLSVRGEVLFPQLKPTRRGGNTEKQKEFGELPSGKDPPPEKGRKGVKKKKKRGGVSPERERKKGKTESSLWRKKNRGSE